MVSRVQCTMDSASFSLPWNRVVNVDSKSLRSALLLETQAKFSEFTSREQAEVVALSLQPDKNLGVFLRTGAGKTMATQLCMSKHLRAPGFKFMIYAVPYIALQRDILERTNALFSTIRAAEWNPTMTPGSNMPEVVVVVYETLVGNPFIAWCHQHRAHVFRVVLDEAHVLVVDVGWRTTLRHVAHVQLIGAPVTIVAGVITPAVIHELQRVIQTSSPFQCIGQSPERGEIRYSAEVVAYPSPVCCPKGADFDLQAIVAILNAHIEQVRAMGPEHRLLVYVQSVEYAEQLAAALQAPVCHAQKDMTLDDPMGEWLTGTKRPNSIINIATDVIGAGVHIPHLRKVIHLDLPSHMFAYLQHTGRAGRDHKPAEAILYYPPYDAIKWRLNRAVTDKCSLDQIAADRLGGQAELYALIYGEKCFQEAVGLFVGDSVADCYARILPIHCARCDPRGVTWNTTPGQTRLAHPERQVPNPDEVLSRSSTENGTGPSSSRRDKANQWLPKPKPIPAASTDPSSSGRSRELAAARTGQPPFQSSTTTIANGEDHPNSSLTAAPSSIFSRLSGRALQRSGISTTSRSGLSLAAPRLQTPTQSSSSPSSSTTLVPHEPSGPSPSSSSSGNSTTSLPQAPPSIFRLRLPTSNIIDRRAIASSSHPTRGSTEVVDNGSPDRST